ncbi:T9SS type A sorting domain-containing protein [Spirosoma fluviale]|uniref:Por secretion system C-terminal sorting domain-containing protein n=1 Tax=Spirosoma fluviale TaxID=1597977 RepID=A0A286F615_9BACT|nr:T9SS type A sorting domain-containing protein [Spirosoma fluviale]SOD78640.1 Por secretion system C-terminal sorting domain-containing protein [Spirosoma fluviale]
MKKYLHGLIACLALFSYQSSFAQCPTKYYTSASTSVNSNGTGTNQVNNAANIVDGDINTPAILTSTLTPGQSVTMSITTELNETVPANTLLYLKANDLAGVTIDVYNGATLIVSPNVTVTTKTASGFSFFELTSTQPITSVKVTYININTQTTQTRLLYEFFAGTQCAPLPVSLTAFTAKAVSGKAVQLNWVTSMERDNDYFVVERSKDLVQFETVGRVKAKEGTQGNTYDFVDEHPYFGTSYYRLKQTDLNGTSALLRTASVILRSDSYGIFPNPVIDNKFVLRLDEPQTAEVALYSSDGRLIPIQKTGTDEGLLMLKSTRKLTTGIYLITVKERAQTRTHRVVVE